MGTTDRICPTCRLFFGAEHARCPADGHQLLEVHRGEDPRIGEDIDGRLTLLGVLGRGGMGVVFRALQHSMCREVAVKLLDPDEHNLEEAVPRFLREARDASRLSHPNVITLFDFGKTAGEPGELYLVMELLRGRSLAQLLALPEEMEIQRALAIARQICDALAAAHARQIVHRDLKPENVIVLDEAGRLGEFVKVIDFGIARTPRPLEGRPPSITHSQKIYGTPMYMAPEQILDEPIDGRADLYALGCLLYQMLTGRLPFPRRNVAELLVAHLRDEPPSPRGYREEIPPRLERLVLRMLAKAPDHRPASAVDLEAELREASAPVYQGFAPRSSSIPPRPSGLSSSSSAPGQEGVTNLSTQAGRFVGRAEELRELSLLLRGRSLVTVHGPGGVGKTRFAIEYGLRNLDEYDEGGLWLCDLTAAVDIDGLCLGVARALGVPLVSGSAADDPALQVSHAIAARGRVLLILDNFEHVVGEGERTVGRWLSLAPEATFLVTSRVRLGVADEVIFPLPPLPLPGEGEPRAAVGGSEAVQLFVDRARAMRPGFRLSSRDADLVAQIVRHLDGMPLAIELAAARMGLLTPAQLLRRLRSRFDVLRRRGSQRGAEENPRQATLRAAIDWSWSLLEPVEQAALAQLSVFSGGFTADAAEGVLDLSAEGPAPFVLDVLQALRDQSLIRTVVSLDSPEELRLGLYESIREYAAERLEALGVRAEVEARQGDYFLAVCGQWAEGIQGPEGGALRRQLAAETENLVEVLRRALSGFEVADSEETRRAEAERALRAVLALDPVLRTRGPFGPHLAWLQVTVDRAAAAGVDRALLARGSLARGEARRVRKRSAESGEDFERALSLARALGDRRVEGLALFGLANLSHGQARIEDSIRLFEEALAVQRAAGDLAGEGNTLVALGAISIWLNRLDLAQTHMEQALRCLRQVGDERALGFVLTGLGALHFERGEAAPARRDFEQALVGLQAAGELRFQGEALMYLAYLDWEGGELPRAREQIGRALSIAREVGDLIYEARYQAILSALDVCDGRIGEAIEGFGVAEARAGEAGSPLVELTVSLLRGQLDLALSREARGRGDDQAARSHLAQARARIAPALSKGPPDEAHPEGTPPPRELCDEVRFVLKMLERGIDQAIACG